MNLLAKLQSFLQDPPPTHAFEISPDGIAAARLDAGTSGLSFQQLPAGSLAISPLQDNVMDPASFQVAVEALASTENSKKRRAALILPDYCSRVAIVDFDSMPASPEEQQALVRFRMKKSVAIDIDDAILSYYVQPQSGQKKKIEVVVAVIALGIVSRYEAPFRAAGFHPGLVTTSMLAALNLIQAGGISVLAKLSGQTLTVGVLEESTLKLVRCVELERTEAAEIEGVLLPTLAFVEDELGAPARRVLLCGFGPRSEEWASNWTASLGMTVEPLRSRLGAPTAQNAGLLGFVESMAA